METKPPVAPASNSSNLVADLPQPGNPVIFKSEKPAGSSLHLPAPSLKLALASFVMLFLVGGVGVGVYLVGQQQQVRSRASNELPENISTIVPKNIVNTATPPATIATPSAKSTQATEDGSLDNIVIPEMDASSSPELIGSESAELSDIYDFNGDLAANSIDLSIMYAGWGTPKNDQQKNADLNNDGIINGIDYSIFLPHFNQPL